MRDNITATAEWYFQEDGGPVQGPFFNDITPDGLADIATAIQGFSAPYLVLGNDSDPGWAMNETYRAAVTAVSRSVNVVRFRTLLAGDGANGDYTKASIFKNASDAPGTGTMFNLLRRNFSKTSGITLTIECRITVRQGVG